MATKITGSFSGKITAQASAELHHEHGHALSLAQVAGTQKSSDPLYDGARITYWGTGDLVNGSGTQQGYWCNEHQDGDLDWGTFEGKVNITPQSATMEGTFKFTGGTGKFKGLTGSGTYKGHFPSPNEVVNNWHGEYTLAAAAKAAR
jgi:hypothetical protein